MIIKFLKTHCDLSAVFFEPGVAAAYSDGVLFCRQVRTETAELYGSMLQQHTAHRRTWTQYYRVITDFQKSWKGFVYK